MSYDSLKEVTNKYVNVLSTVWLPRTLVTSSSCYGALEIVWLLLLFNVLIVAKISAKFKNTTFFYTPNVQTLSSACTVLYSLPCVQNNIVNVHL